MVEKWCVFFDFLGDFMCDGSICHSRCCREWRIDIDPQILNKKKDMPLPSQKTISVLSCKVIFCAGFKSKWGRVIFLIFALPILECIRILGRI